MTKEWFTSVLRALVNFSILTTSWTKHQNYVLIMNCIARRRCQGSDVGDLKSFCQLIFLSLWMWCWEPGYFFRRAVRKIVDLLLFYCCSFYSNHQLYLCISHVIDPLYIISIFIVSNNADILQKWNYCATLVYQTLRNHRNVTLKKDKTKSNFV